MLKHITSSKRPYVEVRLVFLSITTHYLSYSFNLFIWQWSCWYVFRNRAICNEWLKSKFQLQILGRSACYVLKGVCLLHLLSENIFPVLRSNWFYVLMKQKVTWNLSLCYFSLFCFYLSGYDARTAERKSDSTWRTWYKQTARVYHSRRPISWLIPEMQYPVIYIIKFSNN